MPPNDAVTVDLLDPAAADDPALVAALVALVNEVYAIGEAGMWRDGAVRTSVPEFAGFVAAGEIAVARSAGQVVGCVRVHDIAPGTGEFGLLAATSALRGAGVGRALLRFAEDVSRDRGNTAMRLELLVPRDAPHPHKEFLRAWYGRLGYRLVGTGRLDEAYPHLVPMLAGPCELEIHRKSLSGRA